MPSTIHPQGLFAVMLATGLLAVHPLTAKAQGLDAPQAIDTIIGSDVVEGEAQAADESDRIVQAIERTVETTGNVRKTFTVNQVDIVFLPDAADDEGPDAVSRKMEEYADEIREMRQEIEGNALLYHAIDSRQIMLQDVIAVEFGEDRNVVIFAAARPAG